jgi:hypothetical protein
MPVTTNILGGGIAFNEWLPTSAIDYNGDGNVGAGFNAANDGYVEFVNVGSDPINIGGYTFYAQDDVNGFSVLAHTVPVDTILQPGGFYTIVSNNPLGTATTPTGVSGTAVIADFDFVATGATNLILADASGNFIVLQESGGEGFLADDLDSAGLAPANQVGLDQVDGPTGNLAIARFPDGDDSFVPISASPGTPNCFLAGTLISTPDGQVAVEALRPGDAIVTAAGGTTRVLWVGRQTISTRFTPAERLMPVRVTAGALGGGLPLRDLVMSSDHALLIDGMLVNAGALVNGGSVDWVPLAEFDGSYTVYHVETEAHDVILAEGAPTETYIDYVGRQAFENYAEYVALCGADRPIVEMTCPRVTSGRHLPQAIRARLGLVSAA